MCGVVMLIELGLVKLQSREIPWESNWNFMYRWLNAFLTLAPFKSPALATLLIIMLKNVSSSVTALFLATLIKLCTDWLPGSMTSANSVMVLMLGSSPSLAIFSKKPSRFPIRTSLSEALFTGPKATTPEWQVLGSRRFGRRELCDWQVREPLGDTVSIWVSFWDVSIVHWSFSFERQESVSLGCPWLCVCVSTNISLSNASISKGWPDISSLTFVLQLFLPLVSFGVTSSVLFSSSAEAKPGSPIPQSRATRRSML